jgi:four helix bundle protein
MPDAHKIHFDHERLEVYQKAVAFIAWLQPLLESVPKAGDVRDHLDRASTSISLNIAEGNGKYSTKDRARFFDIAYGSALECAAALDILVAKRKLERDQVDSGKEQLSAIVRMLMGLLRKIPERNYDKPRQDELV